MIPYFEIRPLEWGALRIYPFGVMVSCALLAWLLLAIRRARATGLEPWRAVRLLEFMVVAGLAGAWLPRAFSSRFGFSSFAGMFAALAGAALFFRWHPMAAQRRWRYLDVLAWVFPFGWTLLRLGCFLRHEHPGRHSASWLAVAYPDGPRYDLGLLEMLLAAAAACAFTVLGRRPRPPGYFVRWLVLAGPLRMLLGLLRENPPRYFGWTADQVAGVLLTAVGAWVILRTREAAR